MNRAVRTILFLGDGMADEPLSELGGRTPLQAAGTPGMDRIAREGRSGTLLTLPRPYPTSSDVANMSVLGCDLATEYCGRAVLECAGRVIALGPRYISLLCNLVSVSDDGVLADFSGGHPSPEEAEQTVAILNAALADDSVRFQAGVSYRCLLVLSGEGADPDLASEKPDDHPGEPVARHLPQARTPAAEPTAALLRDLIERAAGRPGGIRARPPARREGGCGQRHLALSPGGRVRCARRTSASASSGGDLRRRRHPRLGMRLGMTSSGS